MVTTVKIITNQQQFQRNNSNPGLHNYYSWKLRLPPKKVGAKKVGARPFVNITQVTLIYLLSVSVKNSNLASRLWY